ncbi:E3 ubiquitin-protein ligase CCNB1IP1-like [Chrysoperla carnea]|uniref:E3 ubiquitin-protein ligase CCNB1IP1-like n=1 Tax=Chrysoperla carnea TaxID=189513 RepID=UPI001D089203|nr:E3 ubiquitin-protein ligase CCNB1IP1-like [Chrysoperla carnea]
MTSCSHLFCNEHVLNITTKQELKCPVCNNMFEPNRDIIRVNLNPDEATKSVMMAGLVPEVIMDVVTRALAFWIYQVNLESLYLGADLKTANEKMVVLEKYCEDNYAKHQSEINTLKRKIDSLNEELEMNKRHCQVLIQELQEKVNLVENLQLKNKISTTEEFIKSKNAPNYYDSNPAPGQNPVAMNTAQTNAFRVPKPHNNDFKFKPKSIDSPQLMPPMHPFYRSDTNDEQDFYFKPSMNFK